MRWINFDPHLEHALCCWDQELWDQLFWDLPVAGTAARYQLEHVDKFIRVLKEAPLHIPVLILASDEESTFPWQELAPYARLWIQSPRTNVHTSEELRFLPVGYSTQDWDHVRDLDPQIGRPDAWFFIGQVTHARRLECWDVLSRMDIPGRGMATERFIDPAGEPRRTYLNSLTRAITAPAPSGPVSADTFRCWEALEAGAVPIVDEGPLDKNYPTGMWQLLLGQDPPFPVLPDWEFAPGHIQNIAIRYPRINNQVFAWWQGYKRHLLRQMEQDAGWTSNQAVTVILQTSPIPTHPSTEVIEQVYASIRLHLPGSEVLVLIDGIPPGKEHHDAAYEEYKRRLLWLTNHKWTSATPVIAPRHLHQAEMLRRALEMVNTPLVLYCEHDTPLVDAHIDWPNLEKSVNSGLLNMVRLHHEAAILEPHRPLMLDAAPRAEFAVPLLRTVQWSQRPHLASVPFYRWVLDTYFEPADRTFIEDRMHGIVQDAWHRYGETGWRQFRIGIYAPEGDMKRSWHLDGRADDAKDPVYRAE